MASSSSMIAIKLEVSRACSARHWLPHCLRSILVCPLSRDPFTGRAVSEFGSVRFAYRQGVIHQDDPRFLPLLPHSEAMIAKMGLCVLDEGAVIGTFLLNC